MIYPGSKDGRMLGDARFAGPSDIALYEDDFYIPDYNNNWRLRKISGGRCQPFTLDRQEI